MRRTRFGTAIVAALCGALALAGCAIDPGPKVVGSRAPSATATASVGGFDRYYRQAVDWQPCADGLECATIEVPLDWSDRKSDPIKLSLNRHVATDQRNRIGAIVINPGGPGGSGTDFLSYAVSYMGRDLLKRYDVVGFDPRGVLHSDAVECLNASATDDFRAFSFPATEAGAKAGLEEAASFATACESKTGALLGKVDTMSSVNDLDVIRALLGSDRLDYLGYSYGTYLGARYADKYPEHVGHFVLDGAMNPALSDSQITIDQATAFESELRAYVEDCQAGPECPLKGGVDGGMTQIRSLLQRALASPLRTSTPDRPLTESLAFSGIIGPLYDNRLWTTWLTPALDAALNDNDGSQLLQVADMYADREDTGEYSSNSLEANIAINCLDYPDRPTMKQMDAQAIQLAKAAPTLGPTMSYGGVTCANWPVAGTGRPGEVNATGAPTIVVIGTTHDPATPYQWAQALTEQLDDAVLVTFDGHGHTAYGRSNACVSQAVEDFYLKDTVPKDGTKC